MKDLSSVVSVLLGTLFGILLLTFLGTTPLAADANATLVVTNPANSGTGTLRWALLNVTADSTITFDTAVFPPGAPTTILAPTALPPLDDNNVTVDGSNAGVILDGSQAPAGTHGLTLTADGGTVRGLRIQNFSGNGIVVTSGADNNVIGGDRNQGSGPGGQGNVIGVNGGDGIEIRGSGNQVRGNYIGIDVSGLWDWGNGKNGVAVWQGAGNNTIGGTLSGHRNVISGNDQNGVWIGGAGSDGNVVVGNYLGTRANGLSPVSNGFAGVAIQGGAQNNRIGGAAAGAGNLISGNAGSGIDIGDSGTSGNQVLGNVIGLSGDGTAIIGQGLNGIAIVNAGNNSVGDGTASGRNVISAAAYNGVLISGNNASGNTVQGNSVGTSMNGALAMPNGLHGVELREGAHNNLIGGNRLSGQGNLLSGNGNHGLVITEQAHHNTVQGNLFGPDATGSTSLGFHPFGAIDITAGAHDNTIGGLGAGEGNIISGNTTDGIALFGVGTTGNQLLGNLIGLALDGSTPLPNRKDSNGNSGYGILITGDSDDTLVQGNTVAYNEGHGVLVASCNGNRLSQNAIYGNGGEGIDSNCAAPPTLTAVTTETVTGTTSASARVEFFSDDDDEGRLYEGATVADGSGSFSFTLPGAFTGPNVTATATDTDDNTSPFSQPLHLRWTLLLYLNGDNDLEEFMVDTLDNVAAAGTSPRANVLVLLDGQGSADTALYDVSDGTANQLSLTPVFGASDELNMGDGQTVVDFVTWGRSHYPSRYTLLSIVDHGGGWAPSSDLIPPGVLGFKHHAWAAGSSGLSWDFTGDGQDYDYLDSLETRQAMAAIHAAGGPLDVVFYDVCLMGMTEIAYQLKDYAAYFVSSQNIGWAPLGPDNRYVRTIQGLAPDAAPRDMAQALVANYARALPTEGHPLTVSAVDLAQMSTVASAVNQLGQAISQTLTGPGQTTLVRNAYNAAQKIDYDSDFFIEADSEGFVDLYDFAREAGQQYTDPAVDAAAQGVMTALDTAVVTETHRSGTPWFAPDREWDVDEANGLSVFLPLGEDLEFQIEITETTPISPGVVMTRNLRLRDFYTGDELLFVGDSPAWRSLIHTYYEVVATAVPTDTPEGPVDGVQEPDVTPPQSVVTATAPVLETGQPVTIGWTASDSQNPVTGATLWRRLPGSEWHSTGQTQVGASGQFTATLACGPNHFAVRAVDGVGNLEPIEHALNTAVISPPCYVQLPLIHKP